MVTTKRNSLITDSSIPTSVGIATLALFVLAMLYVSSLKQSQVPAFVINLSDPDTYIRQLNGIITAETPHIPAGLAAEFANGTMYVILANKGSVEALPYVVEKDMFSFPRNQGATTTRSYSFSADGSRLAFIAFASVDQDATRNTSWVYEEDSADLKDTAIPYDFSNGPKIMGKLITRYMFGSTISNDGIILFTALSNQSPTWSIYETDAKTPVHAIAEGFSPRWLSDSEFVYAKTDGLYLATLADPKGHLIIAAKAPLITNNTIDVSNRIDISADGKTLAWSRQDTGVVEIYDITHDGKTTVSLRGTIAVKGDSILLSPHATYLAINEQQPHPRISFYDLSSFTAVNFVMPLDLFEASSITLDDWVSRP